MLNQELKLPCLHPYPFNKGRYRLAVSRSPWELHPCLWVFLVCVEKAHLTLGGVQSGLSSGLWFVHHNVKSRCPFDESRKSGPQPPGLLGTRLHSRR